MPRPKLGYIIREEKCKKCGKNFIVQYGHIYKENRKYYCSWTCYNHRHDKETTPKENYFENGSEK